MKTKAKKEEIFTRKGVEVTVSREELAITIKTWRLRQNLTQKQAAARFGTSRWSWIKMEAAQAIGWETAYKVYNQLVKELAQENGGNI